ncbi:MAG: RraA family protein [Nocardioidaceae bacterium]
MPGSGQGSSSGAARQRGVCCRARGRPKVVGFAATIQLAPLAGEARAASHIATKAVAAAGSTDVLVVANGGRGDVSCWGGLLSLGASRRGIRGVIVDGACRDVDEARELGFPVFARATTPLRHGPPAPGHSR